MLDDYMPPLFNRLMRLGRETTTEADANNLNQIEAAFGTIRAVLLKAATTSRAVVKFRLLTQNEDEIESFYSYEDFEKRYDELEDAGKLESGDAFFIALDVE